MPGPVEDVHGLLSRKSAWHWFFAVMDRIDQAVAIKIDAASVIPIERVAGSTARA